jgi:hypothetical protein
MEAYLEIDIDDDEYENGLEKGRGSRILRNDSRARGSFCFLIPFYFQSVPVHSANFVEVKEWKVEECSRTLRCN